jgi:hypothetical protein
MHLYHVKFIRDGETEPQVVRYRVGSIESAFDKCLREFSEAKLIENWVKGSYKDGRAITVYAPPSTARIVVEPAPEEEQTLFGFLEEVSLNPKKRDRDATSSILQPNSSHIATETAGGKAALLRCCKRKTAASTKTKKEKYHDSINRRIDAHL